jgi:hypothetical protein
MDEFLSENHPSEQEIKDKVSELTFIEWDTYW